MQAGRLIALRSKVAKKDSDVDGIPTATNDVSLTSEYDIEMCFVNQI